MRDWLITNLENFQWCSVGTILKALGVVDGKPTWSLHTDLSSMMKQVAVLKEMDKGRKERGYTEKGGSRETT